MTLEQEYDRDWEEQENIALEIGSRVIFEHGTEIKAGVISGIEKVYEYMTPPSFIWIITGEDGIEYGIHEDDPIMVRKEERYGNTSI